MNSRNMIFEKYGMVISEDDDDDDDLKHKKKGGCDMSTLRLLEKCKEYLAKTAAGIPCELPNASKRKGSRLSQMCGMSALELLLSIREEIQDPSMEEVHKIANLSKPSTSKICDDFSGLSSLEIFEELKKSNLKSNTEELDETANSKPYNDLTEIYENNNIENIDISESPANTDDSTVNWRYKYLLNANYVLDSDTIITDSFSPDEERANVIQPYFKYRPKKRRPIVRKPLLNTELQYNKGPQFIKALYSNIPGLKDIDTPFIELDQDSLPEDHPWFSWMNHNAFPVITTSDTVDNRDKNALSKAGSSQAQDTIRYTLPVSIDLNKLKRVPKKQK